MRHVYQDRRPEHAVAGRPAGDQPGAHVHGLLHPGGHPLGLFGRDQRAHVRLRVHRVAPLELLHPGHQLGEHFVVDLLVEDHALHRDADLTAEREAAGDDAPHGQVDVGVLVHDGGGVGAELQGNALHAGVGGDLAAHSRAAGEGHHRHPVVFDHRSADQPAGADDHLKDVLRQPGLLQKARQEQRRERRRRGGLEHDHIAAGQGRRDLVRDQVEREVERRDGGNHPARLADGPAEAILPALLGVHLYDLAGRPLGLFGRPAEGGARAVRLDPGRLQRLGGLSGDEPRDLLLMLLDETGRAIEDLVALPGRHPLVVLEGGHRSVQRLVELLGRRGGDAGHLVAVPGAAYNQRLAAADGWLQLQPYGRFAVPENDAYLAVFEAVHGFPFHLPPGVRLRRLVRGAPAVPRA